jgi:hypothetical protein
MQDGTASNPAGRLQKTNNIHEKTLAQMKSPTHRFDNKNASRSDMRSVQPCSEVRILFSIARYAAIVA